MQNQQNAPAKFFFWLGTALLSFGIIPAVLFSPQLGNENGPVEMAQNLVLLIGFAASVKFALTSIDKERALWIFASSMFFIAFWRELSWGAAVYALFDPSINPATISSKTLWYRPIIRPVIIGVALFGIVFLVRYRAWLLTVPLLKLRQFPLREIALIVIAALVSTAAEQKMGMSLPLEHGPSQNFEEIAELSVYIALLAASLRVKCGLNRLTSAVAKTAWLRDTIKSTQPKDESFAK